MRLGIIFSPGLCCLPPQAGKQQVTGWPLSHSILAIPTLELLVQLLLLEATFLLHCRKKNKLYIKPGIVEVSFGSRWDSRWSSNASNHTNPAAMENNCRSLAVCTYLSFGGCQLSEPQRFTGQCISLNLWNSCYSSWSDCALLHFARLLQNHYLCWLSTHHSLNLRVRLCLKNPVAFEQVYISSSWIWTLLYAGNSRAT